MLFGNNMLIKFIRKIISIFLSKLSIADAQKNCGFITKECLDAFRAKVLSAHNAYRLKHKVAAAKIATNTSITLIAQEYACTMISNFTFKHNTNRGFLGENLYLSMYSVPFNLNNTASCASKSLYIIYKSILIINFQT